MQSRVAFAEPADLTHPVLIQRIDLLQLQRLRSPNHPVTRSNHINPRRTHVTPEVMLNRSHDAEQILSRNDVEHTPSLNEHTDENGCQSGQPISRLRILPVAVIGSASRNSTMRGYL